MTTDTKEKKKLLVTGGLGFIGSNIIERLHPKFDIFIIDWDKSSVKNACMNELGIKVIHEDIASENFWNSVPSCDFILHAAGQISAEKSKQDPDLDYRSNKIGTSNVAKYAQNCNASVIYCNTIRVYDPKYVDEQWEKGLPVSEDFPTIKVPFPPYAVNKLDGENTLINCAAKSNIKVISHRMTGIIGPGQKGSTYHGWIAYIIQCALAGERYTIYGDGNQSRDILHIDDLVDFIEMELTDFNHFCPDNFAIYNIGAGKDTELSINDVIRILKEKYNLELKYSCGDPIEDEPKHYVSGIDKICQRGWRPLYKDPEQIINELLAHIKTF